MLRRITLIFLSALVSLLPRSVSAESNCQIATTALKTASSIRGLSVRRSVPCKLQSKEEVERYLRDTLKEKIPPAQIAREALIYKLLGLIPEDYDYLEGIVKLYREQIGGYYESHGDYYAMASWLPDLMQLPIAVHELTHALQDQHFDLTKVMEEKNLTTDQQLARSALVEGDATAVMLDYSGELTGAPPLAKQPSVSGFMVQNILGAAFTSSLQSAPPALQALMIFPYVSGLNYVHSLLKLSGYSRINSAFSSLPRSTREVLHSERAFKPIEVSLVPSQDQAFEGSSESSDHDTLGEFVLATTLGVHIPPVEASAAARGWMGDRVDIFKLPSGKHGLVLQTLWENSKESREFYQAICRASQRRFAVGEKAPSDTTMELATKYKLFRITHNDNAVRIEIVE